MKFLNVVIIEDNPKDAELLEFFLRKIKSFKVITKIFETVSEGKKYVQDNGNMVDLVFLDLNLPDSDSYNTVHVELNYFSHIPVIVLTSLNFDTGYEAIKMGASDFINKDLLVNEKLEYKILFSIERKRQFEHLKKLTLYDQNYNVYTQSFIESIYTAIPSESQNGILAAVRFNWESKNEGRILIKNFVNKVRHIEAFWDVYLATNSENIIFALILEDSETSEYVIKEIKSTLSETLPSWNDCSADLEMINITFGATFSTLISNLVSKLERGE